MKLYFTTAIIFFLSWQLNAQQRLFVSLDVTGQNTGQSWTDAFTDLQSALHQAQAGDEIWVAEGTYFATSDSNRSISFQLPSGVKLIGGFSGVETDPSQRDWNAHATVLSGDIGVPGDSTDNTYNVVFMEMPDSNTVIDGFTIRDGVANDDALAFEQTDRYICGGGIYALAGDWEALPTIRNCRIVHNTAFNIGGGALFYGSNDADVVPTFQNCTFENNYSASLGGGFARFGGTWTERGIDFDKCNFIDNHAGIRGGGIYFIDSDGNNTIGINNCFFDKNSATIDGGGASFFLGKNGKSGLYVLNSVFSRNAAGSGLDIKTFNNLSEFNGNIIIDSCLVINHPFSTQNALLDFDLIGSNGSSFFISNSDFRNNYSSEKILSVGFYNSNIEFDHLQFSGNSTIARIILITGASNIKLINSEFTNNLTRYIGSFSNLSNSGKLKITNSKFEKNKLTGTSRVFDISNVHNIHIYNSNFLYQNAFSLFSANNIDSVFVMNSIFTDSIQSSYFPIQSNAKPCFLSNDYFYSINCTTLPSNVHCGPGILSGIDPMFRDTANDDYTLLPCSPLIDAGDNAAISGISTDIVGAPRIQGGTVDMGPYEAPGLSLVSPSAIQVACSNTPGGSVSLEPVNGCEPYTYTWDPPAGNGPMLNDLMPGSYSVTITDNRGHILSDTIEIPAAASPELNGITTDVQCGSLVGGTATVSVTGGAAPFAFQWNNGASDSLVSMLPAGQYRVTVTDANGCEDSTRMFIFRHGQLTLAVDGTPISCNGDTNGELSANSVNGKSPFGYEWSQGAADSLLTNLGPGDYTVTVTDFYGCTASFTFHLTDPPQLQINTTTTPVSNLQMPNGSATVNVQGGSPAYTYTWSIGASTQTISDLSPGVYTVTVTDTHDCTATATGEVQLISGTSEAANLAVQVWPNPMTDKLEIQATGLNGQARVFIEDATGRQVATTNVIAGHAILDVSRLPKGSYQWVLFQNGAISRGKLVK